MLSQRLAKNYFLGVADAESKLSKEQLTLDRVEFEQNLTSLAAAPISTNSTRNELQLVQSQWMFFEGALSRRPDMDALRNIATTSERLLEANNNLAALYEAALKDILGATAWFCDFFNVCCISKGCLIGSLFCWRPAHSGQCPLLNFWSNALQALIALACPSALAQQSVKLRIPIAAG